MQRHLIAALAASLCVIPSLAAAETRTLEVPDFHGVDVSSGIRAIVSGGAPLSVVADASDASDLDNLRYEVRGGILHLWYDWTIGDIFDFSDRQVTVTVGTEVLDALSASAGASIEATGMMGEDIGLEASSGASIRTAGIEGMAYSIESSSGARIEATGLCTDAQIDVSSGASVAAEGLACTRVSFNVSSGASLEVTANGSIAADVSSGGHATVHGGPTVEKLETSSGGSVDFPS
jgi:hypothetical protein